MWVKWLNPNAKPRTKQSLPLARPNHGWEALKQMNPNAVEWLDKAEMQPCDYLRQNAAQFGLATWCTYLFLVPKHGEQHASQIRHDPEVRGSVGLLQKDRKWENIVPTPIFLVIIHYGNQEGHIWNWYLRWGSGSRQFLHAFKNILLRILNL